MKTKIGGLMAPALPDWASWDTHEIAVLTAKGHVKVRRVILDPDVVYPLFLKLLDAPKKVDQYYLEVARLCATKAIADALLPNVPVHIVILPKQRQWALRNFPTGRGEKAASAEWPTHWRRMQQRGRPAT